MICSIPDSQLVGVTNLRLLQIAKQVWPGCAVIVTADTPAAASRLYEGGADYVLRMAKLCAEQLYRVMEEHSSSVTHHQHADADASTFISPRSKGEKKDPAAPSPFASFKDADNKKLFGLGSELALVEE